MKKHLIMAALVAATAIGLASCNRIPKPKSTTTSGTTVVLCDKTFENIMMQEVDVFEYIYPDAHIVDKYCTAADAIDSLMQGKVKTIVVPRELTKGQTEKLKHEKRTPRSMQIAVDAVALIVNPENPVDFLAMPEVRTILSGDSTSWDEIAPNFSSKRVQVVFDAPQSSLIQYMSEKVLDGKPLGGNARQAGSIQDVINTVRNNKYAIGVIGVSWLTSDLGMPVDSLSLTLLDEEDGYEDGSLIHNRLSDSGVKVLGVWKEGEPVPAKPYQLNIYDGTYPLTRRIFMITTAYSSSIDGGFYSFVTGKQGQKLIMKTGVMPARANIEIQVEVGQ